MEVCKSVVQEGKRKGESCEFLSNRAAPFLTVFNVRHYK